jgi:hypothetical protein
MAIAAKKLSNENDTSSKDSVSLYESDFYAWTQEQLQFLRTGELGKVDLQNLTEEIADMGRSEKRELESLLEVLLMHLLKWQFQPSFRSKSWQLTIKEQRLRLQKHLKQNPSLKSALPEILPEAYQLSVISGERETGLNLFPEICPYSFEQIFSEGFLPD